jgi:hypothetical protein
LPLDGTPPTGSTFAPPAPSDPSLLATNGKSWPIVAFQRGGDQPTGSTSQAAYLSVNLAIGLICSLIVALLGAEGRLGMRRWLLLCLLGGFLILLTDVAQGIWMHWPTRYIAVLCTDHMVATVLAGGCAILVLHFWRTDRSSIRPVSPSESAA